MNIPENLSSLQMERSILGGFINHQEQIIELSHLFSEKEFYERTHSVIFQVLKNCVLSGQKIDKVLLAQKVKELSISHHGEIDIFTYLDDLSYIKLNKGGIVDTAKELIKLRIKRDLWENAKSVQDYIKNSTNDPIDKIISHVDGLYNKQVSLYQSDDEPKDLYENIEQMLKGIANNPVKEYGLVTPFNQFNKWFGGLIGGDGIYVVSGVSGQGKSAFLFNMAKGVAKLNNVKCLILDSEMSIDMNMFRAAAAETQVNSWYLKTGSWSRNENLVKQVMSGFDKINQYKGCLYHMYVPNKSIQEIISIAKRWFFKHVGRNQKCLIIYDYLKITESLDKNRQEWQALGDRVSQLNELSSQLGCPIFTGAQQNRTSLDQNGGRRDDHTTVSGSDRINQYARSNFIFREKTLEEISAQGNQFGTHLLMPIKSSRDQGEEDYNRNKNVRVVDPQNQRISYKRNFINFEISQYQLTEKGTFADSVRQQQLQANLQGNATNNTNNI